MFALNEQQVDFILEDIRRNGIELEELQLSLLDHICCVVEEEMSPEMDFEDVYRSILPRFFKKELREIQEETDLLITFKNYYTMKKVMLRTGTISAFVFTIGAIFKMMHWPGAGVLLLLPIAILSFVFLPLLFLIKSKEIKEKREKITLGVGVVFGIVLSLSATFKVMHSPGATIFWLSSLAMLFLVFLPFHFFGGIRNPETKTNTIISSILILMTGGLFFTLTDLSSTKEKIEELTAQTDLHLLATSNYLHQANQNNYASTVDSNQVNKNNMLQSKCNAICNKIEDLKLGLMKTVPGQPVTTEEELVLIFGHDIHKTMNFLFKESGAPKVDLTAIKDGIIDLNTFLGASYRKGVTDLLNTANTFEAGENSSKKVSWEIANFHRVPLRMIIRFLNQLILDIKIIESSNL